MCEAADEDHVTAVPPIAQNPHVATFVHDVSLVRHPKNLAFPGAVTQDSSADAPGIPTFARIYESDGTTVWGEVSVGKTGGSEELLINTVDGSGNPFISAGGPVSISSFTVTFGAGT